MKPRSILLIMGVLVAGWLAFFADKAPNTEVAEAVVKPKSGSANTIIPSTATANSVTSNQTSTTKNMSKNSERIVPILPLIPRASLISDGHLGLDSKKVHATSSLFGVQSWIPAPPVAVALKNPPPPPPPMAPPLNFAFLGKKWEAGVWEVYLARGDTSYIVRPQSVIDGTYRVDAISPPMLTLTYLPLNQVQRLNIGGAD